MKEASEEQAIRAADNGSLERLKASVREYRTPLEPVDVEDWEALGLEDDTATLGGGA